MACDRKKSFDSTPSTARIPDGGRSAVAQTDRQPRWWLMEGAKMSKSVGNVVSRRIRRQVRLDALRYLSTGNGLRDKTNFGDEAFLTRYNADLANDLETSSAGDDR